MFKANFVQLPMTRLTVLLERAQRLVSLVLSVEHLNFRPETCRPISHPLHLSLQPTAYPCRCCSALANSYGTKIVHPTPRRSYFLACNIEAVLSARFHNCPGARHLNLMVDIIRTLSDLKVSLTLSAIFMSLSQRESGLELVNRHVLFVIVFQYCSSWLPYLNEIVFCRAADHPWVIQIP
jgi:hypothetical protein